ncbi:hypothetical protein [Thalassolituus marinus]|uniref:DUF1845 domain-containing protein n=1 Tax=Thalassolituus marinus TaxID=671053 RepID=A0ABS7ZYG0_9GAMM|nr:hypothetical protein [Thalassolituus marinus]MCA6065405.1 hypothetical protein [Thalassolituus marinus]
MNEPSQHGLMTPADLLKELGESPASQIQVEHTVFIRTNPAKHTLAKEYQRIPKSLQELFLRSHQTMRNKEANALYQEKAKGYREEISRQMGNIREDLEKLTNKWEILLTEIGHQINTNYNNPATVVVQITAPQEREFYELVETMDYLLVVMDNLWHAKEQSLEDKQRVTNNIVKGVAGLGVNAERKAKGLVRLRNQIRQAESATPTPENSTPPSPIDVAS